ncbi:hypothetical protein FBUS_00765 [Fasciolopsis buskii]|uniref:Uncharacterized protein n=1 Tax=Fasciolopsis buskii TaxID=27845 RepID=A0A8E0RYR5_9TREM|nr:hypothetical protein FBUS_00765 [Fasciolopsis buski]
MVVELSVWRPKIPLSLSAMARARPPRPSLMLSQPLEGQLPVAESDPTLSDMDALMLIEREAQDVPLFVCPAGCLSKPITVGSVKFVLNVCPIIFLVLIHLRRKLSDVDELHNWR